MGRVAKLIMVTDANNNKFYDMVENDDGSITATWGRVDVTSTVTHYPPGKKKWDSLIKSKLKKGYVDVTHLRAENTQTTDFVDIGEPAIKSLVTDLQRFANTSVKQNYTISAEAVTPQMVSEAQNILDGLVPLITPGTDAKKVNDELLRLYRVIPRKMKKVQYHLLDCARLEQGNISRAEKLVAEEQATLDVMRGQVGVASAQKGQAQKRSTLLEAMGISIFEARPEQVEEIKKFLGPNSRQYKKGFRVINKKTQAVFDNWVEKSKVKSVRKFWHGSRNENWWSILDTGLVLRPTNAVITGKMFGYGIYGANKAQKSVGYCSLSGSYWAQGRANKGFLALMDFHVGNQLHVSRHEQWMCALNYNSLRKKGDYDSLYAHGGADLRNDEFIVYNHEQVTVRYLVEIGN